MSRINLVDILKNDSEIKKWLKSAKKIEVDYDRMKQEIRTYTVGAMKYKIGANYDFERAAVLMQKCQAFLDRLVTLNSELGEKDMALAQIDDDATAYLSGFDAVTKLRNAEIRKSIISSALRRIVKKRQMIADLQEDIEKLSWNLKHTFTVVSQQCDIAKQVWWMRNPEGRAMGHSKR